ncbi:Stk1 family PASTA domain-containing Ser/Thr kinase [Halalkalibacter kiskunsagensis]|uniref:non-specific serine/threonine protein kinase n=1 Tax=Halalkalibacter kiskunsagensis TaxID=1548599 RepID=A0ABV6KIH3_9BACI
MIGQRISGRYEILETIGGGGMANVYKALDVILDRYVAVKVLQPQFSGDEQFIKRFRREAQSATSLAHPNIVNIYDVGEEGNTYYIVMEFVEGQTLKELIQSRGPIPIEESVGYMEQMLAALEHSHENHIIHRDIKPHNILIGNDGVVKITDFGIARAISAATITHTNSVMGSVHYLSPEQARGGHITYKSDIYSLGIVLYEMVTGVLPFSGDTAVSIAIKHLQSEIPSARLIVPELPQSIENIIRKATEKDPLKRYSTIQEMEEDVTTALNPERVNEAPFVALVDDDEATKAIPIIRDVDPSDLEKTVEAPAVKETTIPPKVPVQKIEKQKPKQKKKATKWLTILIVIAILIFGALVTAFFILPTIFQVGEVEVPNVIELPFEEAEEELRAHKLHAEREDIKDDIIEKNYVIRQSQSPGSVVKEGSTIKLYVSLGKEEIELENVVGMHINTAESRLKRMGFQVEKDETETDEHSPGLVLSQNPDEGSIVIVDETTVYLTYSVEKEIRLQDLKNRYESSVQQYLLEEGLVGRYDYEFSNSVDSGRVISQSPSPYTVLNSGDEVRIVISRGKEPEPEPEPEEDPTYQWEVRQVISMSEQEVEEGKTVEIRIVYRDATTNGEDQVFVDETISETAEYVVPLTVSPSQSGSFDLYINGQLEKQTKQYEYPN